jgi:secreted Zn-dependent insulinase-like peptidase
LTFPQDKFHPGHFLNIVLFGIRTKEFTWTENFIEEYQKIIPPDQKHTLVTFSLARLYFNQKKFDQVIEKLRDVEFDELTYNLDSKVLLLATYFEVEEWPALVSLADSFRTFLNRHEKDITAAKKLRYSNFIKFVKRLSKVKYQDQAAKTKVIADIKSTEGVVNQGWLIEKSDGGLRKILFKPQRKILIRLLNQSPSSHLLRNEP